MTRRWAVAGGLALVAVAAWGCGRSPRQKDDAPLAQRRNVLLITLDTTRADRLGCYGYATAQTPGLDNLAAGGVRFNQAFCQVPLTLPSHVSLLTGTYPACNGIRINAGGSLGAELPTLAECFQSRGYHTAAFIGAWVLDSAFGLDRGFDHYDDRLGGDLDASRGVTERRADAVCNDALAWLKERVEVPFFAWVHFFDPHHPYEPPDDYRERFADPYDGEIAFVDAQVRRLLDFLEAEGLRQRTLIVAVGDHGESFNEHDEPQHGLLLYNTTVQVPMIFCLPAGLPAGRVVSAGVRLIDVMPTVLELMGWGCPAVMEGQSLVSSWETLEASFLPAYSETEYPRLGFGWASLRSLATQRWKYIHGPNPELYERPTDPQELENVIQQYPAVAEDLSARLVQMMSRMTPRRPEAVALDSEALDKLASLGYVGGGAALQQSGSEGSARDPKEMIPVFRALMRAKALAQKGRHKEVVALLEPLVRQNSQSAELRGTLAEAYLCLGHFQDARREYEASVRFLANDPGRWCGLGDAFRARGETDAAVGCYRRALDVSPDYGQAHSRLGLVYAEQGDFQRACECFQRCVALSPRSSNALSNLANVLLPLGRPREAVELLNRALTYEPRYKPAHHAFWRALLLAGHPQEAIKALRAARRLLPDDLAVVRDLAWLLATSPLAELRNGEEALRLAQQYCRADPASPQGLDLLAAAYAEAGDFPRAVESARQAVNLATRQMQTTLGREIEARLELYEFGRPYRQGAFTAAKPARP